MNFTDKSQEVFRAVINFTNCSVIKEFYVLDISNQLPSLSREDVENALAYFADKSWLKKGVFEWGAEKEGSNHLLTASGIDGYEKQEKLAEIIGDLREHLANSDKKLEAENYLKEIEGEALGNGDSHKLKGLLKSLQGIVGQVGIQALANYLASIIPNLLQ